ncbi:ABC transporter permease [Mesorhizobium sp. A623]
MAHASSPEHPLDRRNRHRYIALLIPAIFAMIVLFVWPLLAMAGRSFYIDSITFHNYALILSDPIYMVVIGITFRMAIIVTLVCALVGYPVAYVLAHASPRLRNILLIAVILPYFTSIIVRTYAWMILLGREGLINSYLARWGLPRADLLYNQTGVLVGMIYVLLPLMILTLLVVMRGIDQRLIAAALSLGASPWYSFRRVYFHQSLPGLAGGMLLVFILSIGFYITPALMGGTGDITIAMLIQREVEITVNWSFASALAVILLAVTLLTFALYARAIRLERLLGGTL